MMNSKCSYWRSVANWNKMKEAGMTPQIATQRLMSDNFKWNILMRKCIVTRLHLLYSLNWFHSSLCPRCIDWWYLSNLFAERQQFLIKWALLCDLLVPESLILKIRNPVREFWIKKSLSWEKEYTKMKGLIAVETMLYRVWWCMIMNPALGGWKQRS